MTHGFRSTVLLVVLMLAACSGGSGGGTPQSGPGTVTGTTREDYAARLAEWLCDDLAACCDGTGQSFDRDACIATRRATELHRVVREEEKSGRAFDEAMAATCVAKLAETPASCGSERRVSECFRTYDGTKELGEECTAKIQCRGSLRGDTACLHGRCTTRLAAGEECPLMPADELGRCDACRPEARCREAADGHGLCFGYASKVGAVGDPCVHDFTLPADPTTVSIVADCPFDEGLTCRDGTCQPFPTTGSACRYAGDCAPYDRCVDHVCVAAGAAGEECTSTFWECSKGLYCRNTGHECHDPPGTSAHGCSDDRYTGGHCEAPRGEGEACGWFARCAEGLGCRGAKAQYQDDGVCVADKVAACASRTERLEQQAARLSSR